MKKIIDIIKYTLLIDVIVRTILYLVDTYYTINIINRLKNGESLEQVLGSEITSVNVAGLDEGYILGLQIGIVFGLIITIAITAIYIISFVKASNFSKLCNQTNFETMDDNTEIKLISTYRSFRRFHITIIVLVSIPAFSFLVSVITGFNFLVFYYLLVLGIYIYTFIQIKKETLNVVSINEL